MNSSLTNLWERRHLLWVLIGSNLKRQNRNSALGYAWWLLDPLLFMLVYYVLIVVIFQRSGGNQPFLLFLICGLLPWKAFSGSASQAVSTLRGATGIIKAISFPKAVLPLSLVASNLVFFAVAMVVAVGMAVFYGPEHGTWPNLFYAVLPVVLLAQLLVSIGFSLLLSTLGVFFIDTSLIIGHLLRIGYFLSPGLYSIDRVPEKFQLLYRLNPFAGIITSYRDIFMRHQMPRTIDLVLPLIIGCVLIVAGYLFFRRYEGRLVQRL